MDPISQGTLGAAIPASVWTAKKYRIAVLLGCLAGLAPDLDVFIQSDTDPLLFLEYHRQFTHALLFVPVGALVVAGTTFPLTRRWLRFRESYLACILGYASHGLLDSCTSYGTQLFWPFSDYRVSWDVISIMDPLFTIPLLICIVIGLVKRNRVVAWFGLGWCVLYLGFGAIQHERAIHEGRQIAEEQGHTTKLLSAKPTFANLLAWKVIYLHEGTFYIHAIRTGIDIQRCGGITATHLNTSVHYPWLDPASQQARDLERFNWFSQDYLALDPHIPGRVIDMRYTLAPNRIDGLWGIILDPNADDDQHARYVVTREASAEQSQALMDVVTGKSCD